MSKDISRLLNDWNYEPDDIVVRIVPGDDGRSKIQLRVDLGILQFEMEGRPDGLRPEGCESWLDYYEQKQLEYDEAHPDGPLYRLAHEDCARLWREAIQYYHRYLSFWHLDLFELCA
ncbi:MAG: UvrB/UvrC motif-containing protein, partial [Thermoguttaceae bacterium]